MPEFTDPQTGGPRSQGASALQSPPAAGGGDEPLAGLFHMSTTAGRGTQEYVAINHTAVAAFLLGLGSLSALAHPILLLVPVAAFVCAIVAVRQINRSNGTQTGKGWAL